MTPTVRMATRDDVPTLVNLMQEFYAEAGFSLSANAGAGAFRTLLENPMLGEVWLAGADDIIVGYLVLTLGYSMEFGGQRGFVDDFFVRPAARGKGLGAATLAAVKQHCIDRGVRALLVETGLKGHPARRLYERAGFKESERALLNQALAAPLHA